jgi:hypothetical protein
MIVFESIDQFLNEGLGSLKPFEDIPKEWKQRLLGDKASGYRLGGENSKVIELPIDADYKTVLKNLKEDSLVFAIIKQDGQSRYMIEKISPNKFNVKRADGEYSVRTAKRKEEEAAREAERLKREQPKNESLISERWGRSSRRSGGGYDSSMIGEMSVPDLQKWMAKLQVEKPESKFQLFLIFKDVKRTEKVSQRGKIKQIEDPLVKPSDYYSSRTQKHRYEIFAEKKRAKIDKQVDQVIDDLKQQITDNFDVAIEKVLSDMRKGYSWNVDAKTIGEKLMSGINLTKLIKFAEAYDAVEPDSGGTKNPNDAAKKLKKLGF